MQAEELRNMRKMRGLTLDEVCQKLGRLVSKQALSKYERGKMRPSVQVLDALLSSISCQSENEFSYEN